MHFRTLKAVCIAALYGLLACDSVVDDSIDIENPIDAEYTPLNKAQISITYSLPYMSGEAYRTTGHSEPDEAWDFNLSSGSDCGEPVIAVTSGIVDEVSNTCKQYEKDVDCNGGAGNFYRLKHNTDSYYSRGYHLAELFVVNGQEVERGQVLGTIGNSGNSNGCHLHMDIASKNGSSYTSYEPKYYFIDHAGKQQAAYLSGDSTTQYRSYNNAKFESCEALYWYFGMKSKSLTASRVTYEGFAKYYDCGIYGDCAIYYEALGCGEAEFCQGKDNNTKYAWLVYGGFYQYYFSKGGPNYTGLGYPTGNAYAVGNNSEVRQNFRYGYLYYDGKGHISEHEYI